MSAILLLLFAIFPQMPKNDPNGIWEVQGLKFEFKLSGANLHVHLVSGADPTLLSYEVDLKNQEEINTYSGKGSLVAKVAENKQCTFDVEWSLIVANQTHIVANIPAVIPQPGTCNVKERVPVQLEFVNQ
jgi:hypothetical protein